MLETVSGLPIALNAQLPDVKYPFLFQYNEEEKHFITHEIDKLLSKKVIGKSYNEEYQYVSPIFVRKKPDGEFRLILNLKKLNTAVNYIHFKMDTIIDVIYLIQKGSYMVKFDLKDAYYSVPIKYADRKLLKFVFNNEIYMFKALPNGYTEGPRRFTKLIKPVLAFLRTHNVSISAYIDDLFITSTSSKKCYHDLAFAIHTFESLGFTINHNKSMFVPSKTL